MSKQIINVGSSEYDGTGDRIRSALSKCNSNFAELYENFKYVSGRWYIPGNTPNFNAGSAPGQNSIRFFPGFVREQITISNLGARITTGSSGGNVQLAIYAMDDETMLPTGNALVSTASMGTGSVANVSSAASLQLGPGVYWFASNADNNTVVLASTTTNHPVIGAQIGSTNLADILGPLGGGCSGIRYAASFGSWPDLTGVSFSCINGIASVPIVAFQIASVP